MPNDNSSGTEESKDSEPPNNDNNTNNETPAASSNNNEIPGTANNSDMELETSQYADSVADSCIIDLSSTTAKLQRLVDKELDKLMAGEIEQLSAQTNLLMERLVSISGSMSGANSVTQASGSSSLSTPLSFAQVAASPKATALTASDVRRLPRLDGSSDVDVAAVLSQFRLVAGFKAKTIRPNDEPYADSLAFEYLSLICDGLALAQYQQLSAGAIDWHEAGASSEASTSTVGSFTPPETWAELSSALLDLLMPSNSVEECALKLASFKQGATESVSEYTLRFRTITQRFESAVERQTHGRTPWAAFSVTLFQHGLIPAIQCLQLSDKPVTSLREAVDRARRHEAASLAGGTVSAMSFTPVPNRAAVSQAQYANHASGRHKQAQRNTRQPSNPGGAGGSPPPYTSGASGGGGNSNSTSGPRAERPKCGYPRCRKPLGHTTERCYQRRREEKETEKAGKRPRNGKGRARGKKRDESSDEEDP